MTYNNPSESFGRLGRDDASTAKAVNFFYIDGGAKRVSVVGDFNDWTPGVHEMKQRLDGSWHAQIELENGHHKYMLQVDDALVEDPKAHGIVRNDDGQRVCMVAVSGY